MEHTKRGVLSLLIATLACGAPEEPQPPSRAEPTRAAPPPELPPQSVEGEVAPGRYFFPAQPISHDGFSIGHVLGLHPMELLSTTQDGYRVALRIGTERVEAEVEPITPAWPHACLSERTTLTNGQLRAQLAPGSVVAIRAMDERWAEISVAIGLRGIVPRSALSLEGCVTESEPLDGEIVAAPVITGSWLTCLFPTREPSESTPAAEIFGRAPLRILERAPRWLRVQARHGAVTLEGWTPALDALPPQERPPVIPPPAAATTGFSCRRTTRPLELGNQVVVPVPAGTMTRASRSWTDVYLPLGDRAFLQLRPNEVPEDALGPETPGCTLNAWEPWDGYLGRCFHPGEALEETAAP